MFGNVRQYTITASGDKEDINLLVITSRLTEHSIKQNL